MHRFEEQMRQKERLIKQFNYNMKERDAVLNKKNHATLILATLEHSMISTVGQYVKQMILAILITFKLITVWGANWLEKKTIM